MFENFVIFTEVVKLSSIIFNNFKLINHSDNVLFTACINQDIEAAKQMFPQKEDKSIVYHLIKLLLPERFPYPALLRLLFDNVEDFNEFDQENKDTILNYACECGFLDIVKKMIEVGANVNNPEYELLYSAIIGNKTEVAKCLIENGAETSDCSLFEEAIANNQVSCRK